MSGGSVLHPPGGGPVRERYPFEASQSVPVVHRRRPSAGEDRTRISSPRETSREGSATEMTEMLEDSAMPRPPILGCGRTSQKRERRLRAHHWICPADDSPRRVRRTTRVFHVERSQRASTHRRVRRFATITRPERLPLDPKGRSDASATADSRSTGGAEQAKSTRDVSRVVARSGSVFVRHRI
jgi:hypothetical protein